MAVHRRIPDVLLGAGVALVTTPFGFGPALGGWLAGRGTETAKEGALAGGLAGALGVAPWVWLLSRALAGAIAPVGYHEGLVHVGVNTAAPGTFTPWQELALAGTVGAFLVGVAVAGGLLAGCTWNLADELRAELEQSA